MGLPQVETTVMELVAEEEAVAKREAALNKIEEPAPATDLVATTVASTPASTPANAVAEVRSMAAVDPIAFLKEQGFSEKDWKLDFTSFPTIVLNDGKFSSPEQEDMGTHFEAVILMHRDTYLYRADRGRKEKPILVYSSDKVHANDADETPIAKHIEEWKAAGYEYDCKEYRMLTAQIIDGPHEGDICQIQVSPASIKKFNGYMVTLGLKRQTYRDVVTQVSVGPKVGEGVQAFNPFLFKKVGG